MINKKYIIGLLAGLIMLLGIIMIINTTNKSSEIKELRDQISALENMIGTLEDDSNNRLEIADEKIREQETLIENLRESVTNKDQDIVDLSIEQKKLMDEIALLEGPDSFSEYLLSETGIDDYTIIEEDLYARGADVIEHDGVLGGTMYFTEVRVLSDRWVYASFEDGHIMGRGLYEYVVNDDGSFRWNVIVEEMY